MEIAYRNAESRKKEWITPNWLPGEYLPRKSSSANHLGATRVLRRRVNEQQQKIKNSGKSRLFRKASFIESHINNLWRVFLILWRGWWAEFPKRLIEANETRTDSVGPGLRKG